MDSNEKERRGRNPLASLKAILEEFPEIREKVKDYIEKHYKSKGSASKLGS